MNIFKILAAGFALTAALPAAAVTINFDQLPNGNALPSSGTTITNQYASVGVTFSGTNSATGATGPLNAWGLIAASGAGGSGNYLMNVGAIPAGGPNNYLIAPRFDISTLTFSSLVSNVSFGLNTQGGQNAVTINAYDSVGTLLQSLANVQANNGTFDIKSLSATGIAKIDIVGQFYSPGGAIKIYGIDNLTFSAATAPVPEPATWAMMIAGFGMTGAAMRRRNTTRTAVTFG